MSALGFKRTNLLRVSLVALAAMVATLVLALLATIKPVEAAFPGKNGKIAFTRWQNDGNFEIYTVNPDGSELTNISNSSAFDGGPSWSPDGTKLAFSSNRDGDYDIYMVNANGSGLTQLTDDPAHNGGPAWSPDGKIIFGGVRGGWVQMDVDGSNKTLIPFPRLPGNMSWRDIGGVEFSPDGTRLALTDWSSGFPQIYVINLDGSDLIRITDQDTGGSLPNWSPDGTKLAFTNSYDGEIYTVNSDGSDLTNVIRDPDDPTLRPGDWDPAWSPDGTKIVFASAQRGPDNHFQQLWIMNADGSNKTRLTNYSGLDRTPDWQPLPAPPGPKSKAECKKGGYKEFGFNNQGECVASVLRAAKSK